MTDWQEAYYDLVNKVECECVQQGDLVPIWDQFKRMALTIQKLQGHQGAMEAELAKFKALAETLAGALELADCALSGANMNMNVVERKVRAAIEARGGRIVWGEG